MKGPELRESARGCPSIVSLQDADRVCAGAGADGGSVEGDAAAGGQACAAAGPAVQAAQEHEQQRPLRHALGRRLRSRLTEHG